MLGVPVKPTIKEVGADMLVERTLTRSKLWDVQTPQVSTTLRSLRHATVSWVSVPSECSAMSVGGVCAGVRTVLQRAVQAWEHVII